MSTLDDLLDSIFGDARPAFYPEFAGWVRESRRYRAFATAYHSKIRARLKHARDEGGLQDLRAELEAAALLLREGRFTLEYETYAAARQRGPDFTVTFKTHTPFNIEVRRIRAVELDDADSDAPLGKLLAVLCEKTGQMPPSSINLLWLTTERPIIEADLVSAVTVLRQRAERKDEAFFTRRGFKHAADFLKQFTRLSGIILHQPGANLPWLNPQARHPAPPAIITAIQRLAQP